MIYFLLGILTWQLITLVFYWLVDGDEEKTVHFGVLIPWLIIFSIFSIKKLIKNQRVRSVLISPVDEKLYYCKCKDSEPLIMIKNYKFPAHTEKINKEYPYSLWEKARLKKYTRFGIGNFRYAPKSIWKNLTPINKNVIMEAKQLYKDLKEKNKK